MSSGKIVFESWLIVMNMQFDFNTKIESTPLWYNSQKCGFFFCFCFYRKWYRKGVKLVSDFLYDDG